ncbi:UNVERIFIED_CONTAM: hypothetical protein Slati_0705000 [Sesamum latifolium]|uniref:Uncharacterized protein n=1 Tax=Sesamum latifolium TaxID=2727402 RepID=A0AAW2Y533_9LAMI
MGNFNELTRSAKNDLHPHKRRREVRFEEYPERSQRPQNPSGRIINMIEGGNYGGLTRSSRKRHLREISRHVNANTAWSPTKEKDAYPITFTEEDEKGVTFPHEDALVISAVISNMEGLKEVWYDPWARSSPLHRGRTQAETHRFLVVNTTHPSYNVILDRPTLNAFKAVISTSCLKIKFPTPMGWVKFGMIKLKLGSVDAIL